MNENPSKSSAAGGGLRPEITTRLSPAPAAGEFTIAHCGFISSHHIQLQ